MTPATPSYSLTALAPVLVVDSVEPSVAFWSQQLGFDVQHQVPGPDGNLIFASVKKGNVEVMYQTRASVIADHPSAAETMNGKSVVLFITVPGIADLDAIERATRGAKVLKPRHDTFYGMTEFYIYEPGGHGVGFAAPKTESRE